MQKAYKKINLNLYTMKTKTLQILLLSLLFLISCKKDEESKRTQSYPINHQFAEIFKGNFDENNDYGHSSTLQTFTITNNTDWGSFLNHCNTGIFQYTDYFSETNIDFSQFMIIAVIDHPSATTVTRPITIQEIIENTNELLVKVDSTISGSTTTSTPSPVHIVKTDIINKPVSFISQ